MSYSFQRPPLLNSGVNQRGKGVFLSDRGLVSFVSLKEADFGFACIVESLGELGTVYVKLEGREEA